MQNKMRRRAFLNPVAAMALTLGLSLGFAPNSSRAYPVMEYGMNLYQSIMNQINTLGVDLTALKAMGQDASEYAETLARHKATLENWAQKLAVLDQMIATGGINRGIPLQRIDDYFNVVENCGGNSSMSLANLMQMLMSKITAETDIPQRQRDICATIQVLQNKKHNDTVDMLTVAMPRMQGFLKQIMTIRDLFKTEGALAESTNNSLQSANNISIEFERWERENKLIDDYIVSLQRQQQALTKQSLKGTRTTGQMLAGTLIQAGTMSLVLKPDKKKSDANPDGD